jgi:hypothetical protein
VRKLLRTFRKARLLVTVDAMHTQTATAKLICCTLKSHYLMIVKSNQPKLLARIQALAATGLRIPSGGGVIVHTDTTIEPLRRPAHEFRFEGTRVRHSLLRAEEGN